MLRTAYERGHANALARFGVKLAIAMPIAESPLAMPSLRGGNFIRPIKRGLGLAALGAGGALAYGLHHQNQQDQDQRNLVYAPMQGAFQ